MKNKSRIKHICIVRPENSTSEHAEALAGQAKNLGVETCFLKLNKRISFGWLNIIFYRFHIFFHNSSYLFLNTPYKEHQPKWLTKVNFNFAYAGYGLTISNWEFGHFSAGMIPKCKVLVAGSEYEFLGYRKVSQVPQKVVMAGNPLMWQIRNQKHMHSINRSGVKQILWAPHWTSSWLDSPKGYSRWREKSSVIFDFAKLHPEIKFVFRPHPLLRLGIFATPKKNNKIYQREIRKSLDLEKDKLEIEILKEFVLLPNVVLSTGPMAEDILQSDALITSGVSIIGYWAATGKPLAIYRDINSPPFGVNGEKLIFFSDIVSTPAELLSWMEATINLDNFDINHNLVKTCEEVFPTFEKSPLQLILES